MGVARLWEQLGPTILGEPGRSLAAFFGHQESIQALSDARLAVPKMAQFAKDKEFDPNPNKLKLPREHLQTMLLLRALALWGSEALIRAAVACAELQVSRQTKCEPSLLRIRDSARITAADFVTSPDVVHRKRAKTAATACQRAYKPFEDNPDTDVAASIWHQLGAPWFAAETVSQDFSLSRWDGPGPPEASATWGNRNSVWPARAAETAAHWSSYPEVRSMIQTALVEWSVGKIP
jgi:hypothetical protein